MMRSATNIWRTDLVASVSMYICHPSQQVLVVIYESHISSHIDKQNKELTLSLAVLSLNFCHQTCYDRPFPRVDGVYLAS